MKLCEIETKWLAACGALAIGEYCGFCCQGYTETWPLCLFVATITLLFGFGFSIRGTGYASLGIAGFALALLATNRLQVVVRDAHLYSSGKPYPATFTLCEDAIVRRTAKGKCIAEFPGEIGSLRVKVLIDIPPGTAPPKAGETWRCTGWLSGWDEYDALQTRQFSIRGKNCSFAKTDGHSKFHSWENTMLALRKDVERRFRIGLEGNEHGHDLLCAMLLGERAKLDARDKKTFVDAGAMHVFAISGLHVMVLARIFVFLSVLTLLPLRFAGVIAIPLVWLYVLMVGSPPSAVRAGAMSSICLVAAIFWRRPNGIVAWAISFLATHIANPLQAINVGSGLSFIVMLALVILIRAKEGVVERPIAGTLLFSCVAWAAALPISIRVFDRIALGGLIAGPLVIPTAMCATICGAIGILASFISDFLAAYPIACAGVLMRVMFGICSVVASIPGANIEVAQWSIGMCLAWYAALAAFFWLMLAIHARRTTVL